MSSLCFWLLAAALILPVIPSPCNRLAELTNYCPMVLAQETAGDSQPALPITPQSPINDQNVNDMAADSMTDSEPAPAAASDADESLSAPDAETEKTPAPEPDASGQAPEVAPSDSQAPPVSENQAEPAPEIDSGAVKPDARDEDVAPMPSTGATRWDRYHAALSRRILNSAEWIDSFFDDERVVAEENRTNIKLRFDTEIEEGFGISYRAGARVRLALPKMEKRLSLVITGDPDEDISEGVIGDNIGVEQFENRDRNISASLWYSFVDTYKRNLSMRVGAQWRGGGPVLWLGPRYRQLWPLESWVARYTWSLRWFTDVGLESRMRLDMERPIAKTLFFRQTTTYNWDQEQDVSFKQADGTLKDETIYSFNELGFSVSLFQPLNRRVIIEYATGVTFVDQPEKVLNNIVLLVRYRRQVWREWHFFEVTPQLQFPWIVDYKTVPSILFRTVFDEPRRRRYCPSCHRRNGRDHFKLTCPRRIPVPR